MAKYGCFRVWQATQFIHSYKVDEFADAIAYTFVDALVPLHITHCRQEVAECFDRTELADAILRSLLNADKTSNRRLNVTIASRLTTPRTSIDDGLAVNNSNYRIVVVHQVASWNVVVPKACMRAFTCAAWGCHEITFAIASNHRSVHKHRSHLG